MPSSIKKESYPKTGLVLIALRSSLKLPTAPATLSATFSTYKHPNTAKGLIGVFPAGTLSFVSELYAGRTSDRERRNQTTVEF